MGASAVYVTIKAHFSDIHGNALGEIYQTVSGHIHTTHTHTHTSRVH